MSQDMHLGTSLDDFLAEESLLQDATAVAVRRVVTWKDLQTSTQELPELEPRGNDQGHPGK